MKLYGYVVHDRDERNSFYHAECFAEVNATPFDLLHFTYTQQASFLFSTKILMDAGV